MIFQPTTCSPHYSPEAIRESTTAAWNLNAFSNFLRLCAADTAQEINLTALGADAGISHNTARAWLSILETSFLVIQCPAWHRNIRKQLVKRPKLHFLDSGLACHLGVRFMS